jgi:hypothetical protein
MEAGVWNALFCVASLHRYGLPVDFATMESETLPGMYVCMLQGTPLGPCNPGNHNGQNLRLAVSLGQVWGRWKETARPRCG